MQDFDRARQVKVSNLPYSVHESYPMYLSTRDMARLGQLCCVTAIGMANR